jgi:hypothetical protein
MRSSWGIMSSVRSCRRCIIELHVMDAKLFGDQKSELAGSRSIQVAFSVLWRSYPVHRKYKCFMFSVNQRVRWKSQCQPQSQLHRDSFAFRHGIPEPLGYAACAASPAISAATFATTFPIHTASGDAADDQPHRYRLPARDNTHRHGRIAIFRLRLALRLCLQQQYK